MEIAKLKVDGVYAGVVMRSPVTAGMVGATIRVEYAAGIWAELTKTVVFRGSVTKDVVTNDTTIKIPPEVLTKQNERLQVGFYGVDAAGKLIIPTVWADLGRIQPGADPSGDPSTDPSLPVWGQIADRVEGIAQDVEELKQGGGPSTPGVPDAGGEDGGYYIPELSQPDEDTIQFAFTPSKPDMPAVEPVTVKLPAGQGSDGNVAYNEEQELTEEQKAQARENIGAQPVGEYLTEVPEGYAKNEDIEKVDRKVDTLREVVSKFHSNIVETAAGDVIAVTDSSDMELAGLKLLGKTIQNGTPTPEAPVPLESVGNGGSVVVSVGVSETDENPQTLTVSIPNGLPGIPVASGGNYTDENGKQWICDEVDFEKGVYIKRIERLTAGNALKITVGTSGNGMKYAEIYRQPGAYGIGSTESICNAYVWIPTSSAGRHGTFKNYADTILAFDERFTDVATATDLLTQMGFDSIYYLRTPIETALSAEELTAYAALHTNYPNTTVFNDGGAGMEVKYVADTKLYIDKKFAELAAALLNQ